MSDYHVLEQSLDRKTIIVALHYDIGENTKNDVNKYYRDIIPMMRDNGPVGMTRVDPETGILTSKVPYIDDSDFNPDHATEPAQITNGEKIEVIRTLRYSSLDLTTQEKKAELEALWATVKTEIEDELAVGIQFYGYSNNAPV